MILILRGERNQSTYIQGQTLHLVVEIGRSIYLAIALGQCLDLLRAKSEGLVPMEIPLGLIPRLMTKGQSAWRKVKIEGSRAKFPSGVFRRCNLGNEKGPDTETTIGAKATRPKGAERRRFTLFNQSRTEDENTYLFFIEVNK